MELESLYLEYFHEKDFLYRIEIPLVIVIISIYFHISYFYLVEA
jgi:hypothetical protein